MCNIKKHSGIAKILQKFNIIIWDECKMAHEHSLDRTLKDLNRKDSYFGDVLILSLGDFRQTLPIIPRNICG